MAQSKKSTSKSIPSFEHSFDQDHGGLSGFALTMYETIVPPKLNAATTIVGTVPGDNLRDKLRTLLQQESTSKKYATKFANLPLMAAFVANDLFTKVWLKVGKSSAVCISRVESHDRSERDYRFEKSRFDQKRRVIPVPVAIVLHGDQGIVTNVNHEQEYLLTRDRVERDAVQREAAVTVAMAGGEVTAERVASESSAMLRELHGGGLPKDEVSDAMSNAAPGKTAFELMPKVVKKAVKKAVGGKKMKELQKKAARKAKRASKNLTPARVG